MANDVILAAALRQLRNAADEVARLFIPKMPDPTNPLQLLPIMTDDQRRVIADLGAALEDAHDAIAIYDREKADAAPEEVEF